MNQPVRDKQPYLHMSFSLWACVMYAAFATIWILVSDQILAAYVSDVALLSVIQTYKALAFIAVTTVLVYLLLERHKARIAEQAVQVPD